MVEEGHRTNHVAAEEQHSASIEMTTDHWLLLLYPLKALATGDKYAQRLTRFVDFLGYQTTKEDKTRPFADRAKADSVYAFNSVLKFFQSNATQAKSLKWHGKTSMTNGFACIQNK